MGYMKQEVVAGKTIEVLKYYSTRFGRKIGRSENVNETPDKQKRVNDQHAERKLRWLINANFKKNDIHLVVTYKKELRPKTIEEAMKQRKNMLDRFKRVYEKQGLEFKYIAVTEYKKTAVHHHLVINNIDVSLLQNKWKYGKLRPTYFDDTGDYGKLASYLIKETNKTFRDNESPIKKRWSASRNLTPPKITKKEIKASKWNDEPKPVKGYYLDKDSVVNGVSEISLWPYQRYTLRKFE